MSNQKNQGIDPLVPGYQSSEDREEGVLNDEKESLISHVAASTPATTTSIPTTKLKERTYNLGYVIKLTLISSIGGFLFGYDTGVIAGAQLYFSNTWPEITELQRGTIVSLAQLGAAVGSLMGGPLSDKYGRKLTILVADVLFTIGAFIMGFAPSIAVLILGRFVVGLGVGIGAMVVPMYLAEASPVEIRGMVIACNVLCITTGQFISYLVCIALGDQWRWMLGIASVPAIFQFFGMLFMPETPVFLYKTNQESQGDQVLRKLTKPEYVKEQKREMLNEVAQVRLQEGDFIQGVKQLFSVYGKCILIGGGLQFWQQFCGINTVMYFGPDILQKAGFGGSDKSSLLVQSLPLSLTNALGTIVAIMYIDKLGRRYILLRLIPFIAVTLLILSLGLGLNATPIDSIAHSAAKWISLSGILLYLVFFSISLGPIPWTVNSEIYPLHLRGVGNSLATTGRPWVKLLHLSLSQYAALAHGSSYIAYCLRLRVAPLKVS